MMTATPTRLYVDGLSARNKARRALWNVVRTLLFRWSPDYKFHRWRILLLRAFGAKIGQGCKVASSCRVWAPWNLEMGDYVCLGANVDCYNVAKIRIGSYSTVSQRAYLCSASHDVTTLALPLIYAPITIGEYAWVCAEAFVSLGQSIGPGAVVGARSVVTKDIPAWTIAAGHPASVIKARRIEHTNGSLLPASYARTDLEH
ncbi:MAG: putative colanic acid biosynthesis acetyltransferase [Candidatus Accumulibacter propinquus]|jgi:putative colanic acid biosynthesis acetyltransferase WcaF|uniref:putative colanic acid biosynthesis acetyltransferase n=1 Tax=Candidatus Accumulibacter propinquus TaxID=2954380 RepID=UPI002FC33021